MTVYERIYFLTRKIPKGKVLTYGQIGKSVGNCPARIVGYAMASCPDDVPWQRVVNRKGEISDRKSIIVSPQQHILEAEGILFVDDRINLKQYAWHGPAQEWLRKYQYSEIPKL